MSKSSSQCLENGLAAVREAVENINVTVNPGPYNGPTAQDIADAIVTKQRDVTPRLQRITGTGSQSLTVTPGQRGRIVSVSRSVAGITRMTIDGTAANTATAPFQLSNINQRVTDINNVDLSLVRISNDTAGGATSIVWEEWP